MKKLFLILAAAVSLLATTIKATKMWVLNDAYVPVKVKFTTKHGVSSREFNIPEKDKKTRDIVAGISLRSFSINGHQIPVNQDGAYWFLKINQDDPNIKKIKYELYKVKGSYIAKQTAAILAAPWTMFLSLLALPDPEENLKFIKVDYLDLE